MGMSGARRGMRPEQPGMGGSGFQSLPTRQAPAPYAAPPPFQFAAPPNVPQYQPPTGQFNGMAQSVFNRQPGYDPVQEFLKAYPATGNPGGVQAMNDQMMQAMTLPPQAQNAAPPAFGLRRAQARADTGLSHPMFPDLVPHPGTPGARGVSPLMDATAGQPRVSSGTPIQDALKRMFG